jgi:DNA-binding LacI/PurR family transcriptional regulator
VNGPVNGRCTLEDVALRAGVSRATVSRVVNGNPRVSERVRRAVEQAVAQLGYAPNRAARSLAGSRTDTIALVVSEPSSRLFGDPFLAGTIRGIAAALGESRYQLVLIMIQTKADRERVERHLVRGDADGVLLLSARRNDRLPPLLASAGVPCVIAGHLPRGRKTTAPGDATAALVGFVDADNAGGARQAVAHLLARGCQVVGTVAGPGDMVPGADRLAGWRKALAAEGRATPRSLVVEGDFTRAGGAAAARTLLEQHPDVDGIFAASDLMALGVLDVLRAAGRRVPDDVAVIGFDDSDLAADADPPLTTVRQPIDELGAEMVQLLLAQVDRAAPARGVTLATELVVRSSA